MKTENELKLLAEQVLSKVPEFDGEVIISSSDRALTRFAENVITQNVTGSDDGMSLRLIKDGRMGKARTGNLNENGKFLNQMTILSLCCPCKIIEVSKITIVKPMK